MVFSPEDGFKKVNKLKNLLAFSLITSQKHSVEPFIICRNNIKA